MTIKIDWKGPFRLDKQDKLCEKFSQTVYDPEKFFKGVGLYQVYGHHPVYGSDVLLYIGITTDQSFAKRLKGRIWQDDNYDVNNIEIYLGKLIGETQKIQTENEKKMIKNAEELLIYVHAPAKNSSKISSVNVEQVKSIYVQNYGNCRSLMPEVSGDYWLGSLKNINIITKLIEDNSLTLEVHKEYYGFYMNNQNIWIGILYKVWEEEGFPIVIGFDETKWTTTSENKVLSGEDKYFYFELDLSDVNIENITLKIIEEKIEKSKKQNNIKSINQ
jgi:hypothetical protein